MSGQRTRRRLLFPCTGYVGSMRRTSVPLTGMAANSLDFLVSPNEGQVIARLGCKTVGEGSVIADTAPTPDSPIGVLEAKATVTDATGVAAASRVYEGMWCRQMFPINRSRDIYAIATDDYEQTFGALFADEADHRFMGTLYARSTDGVSVTCSSSGTTVTSASGFGSVSAGMILSVTSGTGAVRTGTRVVYKTDASTLTVDPAPSTTLASAVVTFSGFNYVLGKEFAGPTGQSAPPYSYGSSDTDDPESDNIDYWTYKVQAIPYYTGIAAPDGQTPSSGGVGLCRGSFAFQRQFWCGGGRQVFQSDQWLHASSYYGAPLMWNRRWNDVAPLTNINRVRVWGNSPPLYMPIITTTNATGTDDINWKSGDSFYVSVIFEMEDGSYSIPAMPRAKLGSLSAIGLVQLGTIPGGTQDFRSITWNDLPIGPHGTRARLLGRTDKANVNTAGYGAGQTVQEIPVAGLKITARIPDNITTQYVDGNGNDSSLVDDPKIVRYDQLLAPSHRYSCEFDQRLAVGSIRPPIVAMFVAPVNRGNNTAVTAAGTHYDMNGPDTGNACYNAAASVAGHTFMYRIHKVASGGAYTFQLRKTDGTGDPIPFTPATTAVTLTAGTTTLNDIVDSINATTISVSSEAWKAVLAPNIDGSILAENLAPSSIAVVINNNSSGTTVNSNVAGEFVDVAIGMRLYVAGGTGTLNGATYVTEKISASQVKVNIAPSAAFVGATVHFYSDTYDDGLVDDNTFGNVRCFGPAHPQPIAFRGRYIERFQEQPRDIYFTIGTPGAASTAASAFTVGNRRRVPARAGTLVGMGALTNGLVCCYSNAIYVLMNRKGGTTGEDNDFRMYPLNLKRGCVAPDSVIAFENLVGYLTTEGYMVTDGQSERCISLDIHDAATGRGEWKVAMQQAAAAVTRDVDGAYFHAMVADNKVHFTYALAGGHPQRRLVYDFSRGAEASGLNAVLRDVGSTESTSRSYGWSAPLTNSRWGCMTAIRKSTSTTDTQAVRLFACSDEFNSANSTGDGRFYEFDLPVLTLPQVEVNDEFSSTATCTWGPAVFTITGATNAAIGSAITANSGIAANTFVTAKNTTNGTLTISNATTTNNPTGQTVTFNRQVVQPVLQMAADMGDSLRALKSAQDVTLLVRNYTSSTGKMTLTHNYSLGSPVVTSVVVPQTSTFEQGRIVLPLPQTARTPGHVCEFGITHQYGYAPATPPEIWGITEATIEELDGAPAY